MQYIPSSSQNNKLKMERTNLLFIAMQWNLRSGLAFSRYNAIEHYSLQKVKMKVSDVKRQVQTASEKSKKKMERINSSNYNTTNPFTLLPPEGQNDFQTDRTKRFT
jgi:hypothetical protein